jgi:uncharacterized protein YjbI with pentapeptide repeats
MTEGYAMANREHLAQLQQGVGAWNQWREANRNIKPDLLQANLTRADLCWAKLSEANLVRAKLTGANLFGADLSKADLSKANLSKANLFGAKLSKANLGTADLGTADLNVADFTGAKLTGANLFGADFTGADFTGADLTGANLENARLIETYFGGANLTGCRIFGISAWNVYLTGARQADLVIQSLTEPVITVDDLEMAQFIYLLLHNEKIRHVIETITSKAVLILGRFTPERKAVLDAIREELRRRNYLPILFDFEKPVSRDLTETISTLAHMARFIIADLTEAKSIPQELQQIVPDLPSVPVQPILQASAEEYSMFEHFKRYPWVLPLYRYKSIKAVIASLKKKVIAPAELKARELSPMKSK